MSLFMRKPRTLYSSALKTVSHNYHHLNGDLIYAPEGMRFDIYSEMFNQGRLSVVAQEFGKLEVFMPLLKVGERRSELHKIFQAVLDHGDRLNHFLTESLILHLETTITERINEHSLALVLNYASFLSESGWYCEAERVLRVLNRLLKTHEFVSGGPHNDDIVEKLNRECKLKLLYNLSSFCKFDEAKILYRDLQKEYLDDDLEPLKMKMNEYASLYNTLSSFCFDRSEYWEAYRWSMLAVKSLKSNLPPKVIIDVLRQSSKSCVVRRQFNKAEILIQEALLLAKDVYGERHSKYADTLIDYGFFLLNSDSIIKSLQAYQTALEVRQKCYGSGNNLLVAVAHECLAYATYVFEYNSGHFERARSHADKALEIISGLLPDNHLLLASSKRVLALILEEIAIETSDQETSKKLLNRANSLHLSALTLSVNALGEMNVQTAKHYGNLGRLNQSMQRFDLAEEMHLKAIDIKEKLLGSYDYEVCLSIGHLASLYNYDLKEFTKAEVLYLRSIKIGLKLFGPAYSGLEYDYRGLIRVYQEINDWSKFFLYTYKLRDWKDLRDERDKEVRGSNGVLARNERLGIREIIDSIDTIDRQEERANQENNTENS